MKLLKQAKMEARSLGIPAAPICQVEDDEVYVGLVAWEISSPKAFDWAKRTLTDLNRDFIFGVGLKDTGRGLIDAAASELIEVMEADSFDDLADLRDARQYELHGLKKFGDDDFVFNPSNHQMTAIVLYRQQI
ncbi:hypothetical protein [Limnobacter sp.]|uniref:hypothetical protein n=1 Tax=Limnobacter sp. TaxID=2003368 RepID=UPI00391C4B92